MKKNFNGFFRFHFPSYILLSLIVFCFFQFSCNTVSTKDICEVSQNPFDYQNQITLTGIVTESSSVLGYSIFTIKDKSKDCIMMVLSSKISPPLGKTIKVKGTLKEISNIDNNRKLIFVEKGVDFDKIKNLVISNYDLFLNQN